jgi:AAA15 family ATPase/GTPase
MENQIQNLEIQNFKSIKHLQLDCKRVNIFIGEPNVGKSNILEALSLLGAGYETNYEKYLSSFIRYENFNNLFYDKNIKNDILVETDKNSTIVKYNPNYNIFGVFSSKIGEEIEYLKNLDNNADWGNKGNIEFRFNRRDLDKLHFTTEKYEKYFPTIYSNKINNIISLPKSNLSETPVKKYDFKLLETYDKTYPNFLNPPFGDNLFAILDSNNEMQEDVASFFEKYGLKLRFNTEQRKLEIQKDIGNRVYTYPYSTIADTLQRIIFYLTAIESNKNSVLLFEEPEAHSFPPYVGMLADRIAADEANQYFIATHSPYLLSMIEKVAKEDLNVIITYFENYETKIKVLSNEEVREMIDYSIDAFYNLERFLDHEPSYES